MTNKFAAAALTGLLATTFAGAALAADNVKTDAEKSPVAKEAAATAEKGDAHACKGLNSCKGKGGCKTGDNGCAGKNSCKGKGGCKTEAKK